MIILSSRTMAPRNVTIKVVSASPKELEALQQAAEYYKSACRSIVGYKQLMAKAGVEITIQFPTDVVKEKQERVMNKRSNQILDKFKVKQYRRQYDTRNPNLIPVEPEVPKQDPNLFVLTITDDIWVPDDMYNEVMSQPEKQVTKDLMPETIPTEQMELKKYSNENKTLVINLGTFMDAIQSGIQMKKTRTMEEVDTVVKAVWKARKDQLHPEHKAAARQFCIEVHNSYSQLLSEQPQHWKFLQTEHYITSYFQEAKQRCSGMI